MRRQLDGQPTPVPFRLIRSDGRRAIIEVSHRTVALARARWTGPVDAGLSLTPVRTWGTLLGAKAWLARGHPPRPR